MQDIRYGVRTLIRTPGFTLIAVAVLALGIGANAFVFSVANAFFLRPLPVADPSAIVRVYSSRYSNTPYRSYLELRDRNSTLAGLAAFQLQSFGLRSGKPLIGPRFVTRLQIVRTKTTADLATT